MAKLLGHHGLTAGSVTASMLATAVYPVGVVLSELRQVAAIKDALPDAPNGTTLGLADAAGSPVVGTTTNTNAASETAAFDVVLPANYVNGGAVTIWFVAKVSAQRGTAQTIDLVAKRVIGGELGADICATTVITLTTEYADHYFTITPTSLLAGDVLHCEVTLATNDTGGGVGGYPIIAAISLRPTVRV